MIEGTTTPAHSEPVAGPVQRPVRPLVEVLAAWEDQNGTMACVLPSEWDSLRQDVMDACVTQSPRMLRNELAQMDAELLRLRAEVAMLRSVWEDTRTSRDELMAHIKDGAALPEWATKWIAAL